ncbi:MAG: PAS domain S-box protein [Longimicrobiales bacterium]
MSQLSTHPYPSEEVFRLLVETVEDYAICLLDLNGRVTSWNRGATRIAGFTEHEIVGQHFSIFYPADDVSAGRPELVLRTAAANGRYDDEGFQVRKDGSSYWARVSVMALHDTDGQVVGYAALTHDLSDGQTLDDGLHSRELSLAQAQHIVSIGSWTWDVAANRVTWSDELYRIYGIGPGDFGGTFTAFLAKVHPEDRANTRAAIENAYATRQPFDFEERIVRSDGATRVLRSRGRVITDATGAVLRMVGTCEDITEEKQREESERRFLREQAAVAEARAAAQRFEFLARASDVMSSSLEVATTLRNVAQMTVPALGDWCAIDLLDSDGTLRRLVMVHGDPERVRLAEVIRDRYAVESDDPVRRAVTTQQPELIEEILEDGVGTSASQAAHVKLFRRFGLRSLIICPMVSDGRALGAISVASAESGRRYDSLDLAHVQELARRAAGAIDRAQLIASLNDANGRLVQKTAELEAQSEALQQAVEEYEVVNEQLLRTNDALGLKTEEAERALRAAEIANRAKSDFLARMSHELRTPLNAIAGYAQLMELGVHGPVTEAQITAIHRIQRNQRHLLGLINDILNFVKLEAGHIRMDLADVRVADVLGGLEALIDPQVRVRGLIYTFETPDVTLVVRADREKLDQVLLNLLSNAIKFTLAGGQISVRCESDAEDVRILVLDTGVGIPADKLESIFEPFVQLGTPARSTDSEGVGLGLAISRDLLSGMGGRLTAKSELGRGSTFTVVLPRPREARRKDHGMTPRIATS